MRFHTDPHVALALLEHRASGLCCDGVGEFLQSLGTAAPDLAAAAGDIAPVLGDVAGAAPGLIDIGAGAGTLLPGVVDNTLSSGLLDALNAYGGIDPSLLTGGVLDAATGAMNLSGTVDNSLSTLLANGGSGISDLLRGGTGLDLSGLTGGTGASGGGTPSAPQIRSPGPSGITAPSPFSDGAPRIDNTLGADVPTVGSTGSSAITAAAPAAAAGAAPGAAAAAPAAGKGVLGGINGFLRENAPLLSLGALGASALMPKSQVPNMGAINANASAISDTAKSLIPSVSTGVLPAGAEQMVKTATNDAITGIRAKYANLGLSGSSMEQQDINAANERAQATRFQIAQQLTTTGLNAAGLADQIYAQIAGIVLGQDQGLQTALANFAQAMGVGQGVSRVA